MAPEAILCSCVSPEHREWWMQALEWETVPGRYISTKVHDLFFDDLSEQPHCGYGPSGSGGRVPRRNLYARRRWSGYHANGLLFVGKGAHVLWLNACRGKLPGPPVWHSYSRSCLQSSHCSSASIIGAKVLLCRRGSDRSAPRHLLGCLPARTRVLVFCAWPRFRRLGTHSIRLWAVSLGPSGRWIDMGSEQAHSQLLSIVAGQYWDAGASMRLARSVVPD